MYKNYMCWSFACYAVALTVLVVSVVVVINVLASTLLNYGGWRSQGPRYKGYSNWNIWNGWKIIEPTSHALPKWLLRTTMKSNITCPWSAPPMSYNRSVRSAGGSWLDLAIDAILPAQSRDPVRSALSAFRRNPVRSVRAESVVNPWKHVRSSVNNQSEAGVGSNMPSLLAANTNGDALAATVCVLSKQWVLHVRTHRLLLGILGAFDHLEQSRRRCMHMVRLPPRDHPPSTARTFVCSTARPSVCVCVRCVRVSANLCTRNNRYKCSCLRQRN